MRSPSEFHADVASLRRLCADLHGFRIFRVDPRGVPGGV